MKMLEYDRINISEGTDINKCEETSRECSLCKFIISSIKILSMDHIYVMVFMICL